MVIVLLEIYLNLVPLCLRVGKSMVVGNTAFINIDINYITKNPSLL